MIYQLIKELKRELDTFRPLSKEQEGRIMQKFRLDWNYHSNHLEGNSLTYGETKALILFGLTAQGKPLKDHFEITGHDEAVKWIEDVVKQERPLTENFIRELHTLLLKEPYEKKAISLDGIITTRTISVGKYKTVSNHVLTQMGEPFYFATPEETPAEMGDLMAWYQTEQAQGNVEPILLAATFHYRFIRIHPFDDGNGRTARLIMNFILMRFGYPPVIIRTEDKANYFNVLRLADAGNIEPFVEYIAQNLVRSLEIMVRGAKGESIDDADDLDKEIALLEMKLKGMDNRVKKSSKMVDIYTISFRKIKQVYSEAVFKMGRFYEEIISEEGCVNSYGDVLIIKEESDFIIFYLDAEKEDIQDIFINQRFNNFNKLLNLKFDFISEIAIKLNVFNYSVRIPSNSLLIEKPYSEQLTDEEIDFIVKSEMKRHTEFIESKIKEME